MEYGKSLLQERLLTVRAPLLIFVFKQAATTLIGRIDGHGLLPPAHRLHEARIFVMPGPYEHKARVQQALSELKKFLSSP